MMYQHLAKVSQGEIRIDINKVLGSPFSEIKILFCPGHSNYPTMARIHYNLLGGLPGEQWLKLALAELKQSCLRLR